MKIKLLFLFFSITSFTWSQNVVYDMDLPCNTTEATGCVCQNSEENDCDLLPDIQASWYGILNYAGGPSEYPQTGAGENNGRLRISVSTPNTGFGPLTVRGVDDNGYAYFLCDDDTIAVQTGGSIGGYYCDDSDEPAKHLAIQRVYRKNPNNYYIDYITNGDNPNSSDYRMCGFDDTNNNGIKDWNEDYISDCELTRYNMEYYDRFAGTMTYHPTHGHMHSDEWGVFTLRIQDPNEPNPLNWPIVSNGAKMGFCLMDYNDCGDNAAYGHCRDENRYSDQYLEDYPEVAAQGFNGGNILTENSQFPNNGLGGQSYGCSVIEQGITVGWTDIYSEYLDDQWIDIDPGLCNGEYWIVGEIDRNNFYLESNKDNNWTAAPFTLTQQLDSQNFEVEIITESTPILCEGESITLSSSINNASMSYSWSNGMTGPSIQVSEPGIYYVEVTSECGSSTSESIEVTSTLVATPAASNVTIDEGNTTTLYATGSGNIFWTDNNGIIVGEGQSFTTPPLYEDTSYFVYQEEEIIPAPEFLSTGEEEHLCDGGGSCDYSGTVYNGGLRFEALSEFTLNSVKVYAGLEGERSIQLRNTGLNVVYESTTINIPESEENGFIVDLNWVIPAGEYIITTDSDLNIANFGDNNPLLKRTTGSLASFPHIIEGIVSINEGYYNSGGNDPDEAGFNPAYYYYFYDWKINNDWDLGEISCTSDLLEVNVFINNNNSSIDEANSVDFGLFPNPAFKQVNIEPSSSFNEDVIITIINELGEEIEKIQINNFNESINLDIKDYSSGMYFIKVTCSKGVRTKPIMFK